MDENRPFTDKELQIFKEVVLRTKKGLPLLERKVQDQEPVVYDLETDESSVDESVEEEASAEVVEDPEPSFFESNEWCIAHALGCVGAYRRPPICGTYASNVVKLLAKRLRRGFTDEELENIVRACMDEEPDHLDIRSVLPKETVEKLSRLVPVFMVRPRNEKIRAFLQ